MLPKLDMFKRVIFTQRIIVFNESYVPQGTNSDHPPFACLWYEGVSGRKKDLSNSGKVCTKEIKLDDFYKWPDNMSQPKINRKNPRPYLKEMVEVTAQRGSYELRYKTQFSSDYINLNFLKVKSMKVLPKPPVIPSVKGISKQRKEGIIQNLFPLMPASRLTFWRELQENVSAVDLKVHFE